MNELQFWGKVRQLLNEGMALDSATLERLRQGRELALRHQLLARPAGGFAWANSVVGQFGGFGGFSLRLVLPMAVLVVGLVSIASWQQSQNIAEVEEIDAQLLTDDLPVDAYLDKGFDTWLKKRASF